MDGLKNKDYLLKEIKRLTEEIQKPIKRPVDKVIRNHQMAWLGYYEKELDYLNKQ